MLMLIALGSKVNKNSKFYIIRRFGFDRSPHQWFILNLENTEKRWVANIVQSSDANPIKHVWSVLKRKLAEKRVFTLKQLSQEIRKIWQELPTDHAEKLVERMPKRCQAILDNDGDWTIY